MRDRRNGHLGVPSATTFRVCGNSADVQCSQTRGRDSVKGSGIFRPGLLAVALSAFLMPAVAQEDPLAWFPLRIGSRWVYEHEWKSGDRNRPDVDRWTTEETITAWVTIPEGLGVLRELKQQANATDQPVTVN